LTAGASVLAVIAPVAESADRPADAGANPTSVAPSTVKTPDFDPTVVFAKRPARASRALARRVVPRSPMVRRAPVRHAAVQVKRHVRKPKPKLERARRVDPRVESSVPAPRRARAHQRVRIRTSSAIRPGMGAVIAFARSQVGKGYASGADGPSMFDCSGFTMSAYARAGISLPHSSGGQAARARSIPRSMARPGDLVVGPGHVGIYMGGGMMIDAGNRRTGVVFRKLYGGLHVERL
jgi:cell wall-associated NlpC family hydrolase